MKHLTIKVTEADNYENLDRGVRQIVENDSFVLTIEGLISKYPNSCYNYSNITKDVSTQLIGHLMDRILYLSGETKKKPARFVLKLQA
jgi:hypothetical protein